MGSDLYDVRVERWESGTLEAMAARAAAHGLDEALARDCIRRCGGESAVEVDLYIHQIHPDAPIWELDLAYMVMTLHSAGFWPADLKHVSERLEAHFGGFDKINSYEFAPGPEDAPFAYTLLERGSVAGDPERYDPDDESFVPPPEDWARVRVWLSEALGRGMEGARWDSRAWSPTGERTWMNHFPPSRLGSGIGERRTFKPFDPTPNKPPYIYAVAVSDSRVHFMEEDRGAVACFDRDSGEERFRREDMTGGRTAGGLGLSRDGARLYVTAHRGFAGYTNSDGEGFVRLPDGADSAVLREDVDGSLFELQIYTDDPSGDTAPGAVWLRDRETGERVKLIGEHRRHPALEYDSAEISSHTFAAAAPVGASATQKGDLIVWDRQGERAHVWLPEGDVSAIALSPDGGTVYAVHTDGQLVAWDVAEGRAKWQEHVGDKRRGSRHLAASPDGRMLAITAAGRIEIVDIARRAALLHLRPLAESPQGFLFNLGFTPRGDALHVTVDQKTFCLWPVRAHS
ncbi:WD40 repeat domain-containing protein [Polyangium aurulentum]|uniref:WD40 repeat domain-containing protein n=1 Tax=Polyangium aurulentum TaxID=2567896 RepID=UPI0010AE9DB8|nr:PQQ-binding-like beta-propeller repeat protein [Polyangium aurulentum]UQA56711.1 PQQ-binding-like beta-propeller repeat protein [Polyangium aurulentum]